MAEMVKVSLLHSLGFRESKDAPVVRYPRGIVEMPLAHARALGVTHRIRNSDEIKATVDKSQPFGGAFDERLAGALTQAGYKTLADLGKASQSELMAIQGVGPAAYERIISAVAMDAPVQKGEVE